MTQLIDLSKLSNPHDGHARYTYLPNVTEHEINKGMPIKFFPQFIYDSCVIETLDNAIYIAPAAYTQKLPDKSGKTRQDNYKALWKKLYNPSDTYQYWLAREQDNQYDKLALNIRGQLNTEVPLDLGYVPSPINKLLYDLMPTNVMSLEYVALLDNIHKKYMIPIFKLKLEQQLGVGLRSRFVALMFEDD